MVCKLNRWPQIPVSTIDGMTLPRNHETKFRVMIIILSKFILYTNYQKGTILQDVPVVRVLQGHPQ